MMALLLAISLLGASLAWRATARGVGISPDSVSYLSSAESLRRSHRLAVPTSDAGLEDTAMYPPFYPALLAAVESAGLPPLSAARAIAVACFAAAIFLSGGVAFESSNRSSTLALLAALSVASSFELLRVFTYAWSEPPYVVLLLLAALFLVRYFRGAGARSLILAGLAAGLAALTRYQGIAFVLALLAAVSVWSPSRGPRRPAAAAVLVLLCAGPGLFWMMRNRLATGSSTNRAASWYGLPSSVWRSASEVAREWVWPGRVPASAAAALVLLLLAGALFAAIARGGGALSAPLAVVSLSAMSQIGMIVASRAFSSAAVSVDFRTLAPALPFVVLTGVQLFERLSARVLGTGHSEPHPWLAPPARGPVLRTQGVGGREHPTEGMHPLDSPLPLRERVAEGRVRGYERGTGGEVVHPSTGSLPFSATRATFSTFAFVLAGLAFCGMHFREASRWAERVGRDGQGYAGRAWRNSETIALVQSLSPRIRVTSNAADAIQFVTGRRVSVLPTRQDVVTGAPDGLFAKRIEILRSKVERGEAVVAYFVSVDQTDPFLTLEACDRFFAGLPRAQTGDGVVFGIPAGLARRMKLNA